MNIYKFFPSWVWVVHKILSSFTSHHLKCYAQVAYVFLSHWMPKTTIHSLKWDIIPILFCSYSKDMQTQNSTHSRTKHWPYHSRTKHWPIDRVNANSYVVPINTNYFLMALSCHQNLENLKIDYPFMNITTIFSWI